jgi:SpoIID/LytB domain protein
VRDEIRSITKEEGQIAMIERDGERHTLPCETFRNGLNLLSCPKTISRLADGGWMFAGEGEGHGQGLQLIQANVLAAQGRSYEEILRRYFPGIGFQKRSGWRL